MAVRGEPYAGLNLDDDDDDYYDDPNSNSDHFSNSNPNKRNPEIRVINVFDSISTAKNRSVVRHGQLRYWKSWRQLALVLMGCLVLSLVVVWVYPSAEVQPASKPADGNPADHNDTPVVDNDPNEHIPEDHIQYPSFAIQHPQFQILNAERIPEYGATSTLYRHLGTHAELLSITWDDPLSHDDEHVFSVTFRTPPADDTGTPHILEHSVLCGSRSYKTKSPFVDLLKGSLQTFLNAMTYPDRTTYVVSSRNGVDFGNLVRVYYDAVFHPRAVLDPNVLLQEGCHVEFDEDSKTDFSDAMKYSGVVFSEMRGVYSSPDSILDRKSYRAVFPDSIYRFDSGGDPAVIPQLTFEEYTAYYHKYYHPSNSRIYFSGNDDVTARLDVSHEYLQEFSLKLESRIASHIEYQPKNIKVPQSLRFPYAADSETSTHYYTLNWLLNDQPLSATQELALIVLDHLLLGTTSSILYKTLLESGLGTSITGGGLGDGLLQFTYSVGLKGVKEEDLDKIEALVLTTLEGVKRDGFGAEAIESAVNTVEFQLREFSGGSNPRDVSFMLQTHTKWIYDVPPMEALKFEKPLAELKALLLKAPKSLFTSLVQQYLLSNNHRVSVELYPSSTYEEEQHGDEQKRLRDFAEKLSDSELRTVKQKSMELKTIQSTEDSPDAMATIPTLSITDLNPTNTEYPISVQENYNDEHITYITHELGFTSDTVYINYGVDVESIEFADVPILLLFQMLLMQTGIEGEYTDVELDQQIGIHTGGIRVSLLIESVHQESSPDGLIVAEGDYFTTRLFLRGKAFTRNVDDLTSLMHKILTKANLDSQSKALEILKKKISDMSQDITQSGHRYANSRLKARYSVWQYVNEHVGGITGYQELKKLLALVENDWGSVQQRLLDLRTKILEHRDGTILDVTGDTQVLQTVQSTINNFITTLPGDRKLEPYRRHLDGERPHLWATAARERMDQNAPILNECFVVQTQVQYVGKGGKLYDSKESYSGVVDVIAHFLQTGYYWETIRVLNNAYGAFMVYMPSDGLLNSLSYRDPNLLKTLDVYNNVPEELSRAVQNISSGNKQYVQTLTNAIIGTIGDIDGPGRTPEEKGWIALLRWMKGSTEERRQRYRDDILKTNIQDFLDLASRLANRSNSSDFSVAVVGSNDKCQEAIDAGMDLKLVPIE
eukprot:CAMPEP_0194370248 /NCGR_PEP_ID=MMETSP0174-20130528/18511_1 /TAXON_ID=216777 /ORGANISM="Proboscia alata, Strain PI-D3" /LENGTH=1169 /DNA_ID=CAMNT_0039147563 /DNA_START=170 /DNA_END=3679 /DNA_ORIENTATION=-